MLKILFLRIIECLSYSYVGCSIYNLCRSKINGYSSRKAGKRKWMYTGIRILHSKVDCNKLMIYTVTLKNPPKN